MRYMKIAGEHAYTHASAVDEIPSGLRKCAISFDASWHSRGHYSNQGFAAAIDTDFGKVLDYSLYDRVCYSCSKWPVSRRCSCPEEIAEYWESQKNLCTANYKGTSHAMESTAAVDVWKRSIETHNIAYGTYIEMSILHYTRIICNLTLIMVGSYPGGGVYRPCAENTQEVPDEKYHWFHESTSEQSCSHCTLVCTFGRTTPWPFCF